MFCKVGPTSLFGKIQIVHLFGHSKKSYFLQIGATYSIFAIFMLENVHVWCLVYTHHMKSAIFDYVFIFAFLCNKINVNLNARTDTKPENKFWIYHQFFVCFCENWRQIQILFSGFLSFPAGFLFGHSDFMILHM